MGADNPKTEDPGEKAAARIERLYLDKGQEKAAEAFRQDLDDAAKHPEHKARFEKEVDKLEDDDKYQHVMSRLALEWAGPKANDDVITREKLSSLADPKDNTADAKYDALMAEVIEQHYDSITSGASHVMSSLWHFSSGIRPDDVDREKAAIDGLRSKAVMTEKVNEIFMANDGAVFNKLANRGGTIDQATLLAAVSKDKAAEASGGERTFTDQQRQTVQWIAEHYSDPVVQQLKNYNGSITRDSINQAVLDAHLDKFPPADTSPALVLPVNELLAGREAEIPVFHVVESAKTETAEPAQTDEAARKRAEEEAKGKTETAEPAQTDEAARKRAEEEAKGKTETAEPAQTDEAARKRAEEEAKGKTETAEPAQTDEAARKRAEEEAKGKTETAEPAQTDEAARKRAEEEAKGKTETAEPAQTDEAARKRAEELPQVSDPYDLHGGHAKPPKAEASPERHQRDEVKVLSGEGYWDVAARMLGFTDDSTSLRQRREHIVRDLTGHDRAQIYSLMEQMRKAHHDNFRSSKLHEGKTIRRPHK